MNRDKVITDIKHVSTHLGMFAPGNSYDEFCALLVGMDLALEGAVFEGFKEWFEEKHGLSTPFWVGASIARQLETKRGAVSDAEKVERMAMELCGFLEKDNENEE